MFEKMLGRIFTWQPIDACENCYTFQKCVKYFLRAQMGGN